MHDNGFRNGNITYEVATVASQELADRIAATQWTDGFVTFANSEKLLMNARAALSVEQLTGRVTGIAGAEGYVSEVNLWNREGSMLHEIAAERVNDRFIIQCFRLDTAPAGEGNCWYRDAETRAGSHHKEGNRLFSGILNSVEVVWPEKRLNFYITRGEN